MKIHTLLEMGIANDIANRPIDDRVQTYLIGIIDAIKKAQPFFQKSGKSDAVLWRGVEQDEAGHSVYVQHPRQDRRPRDSATAIHEALNMALQRNFGFPYRSGGLFTTGDRGVAVEYGSAYIVLPHGDFDFCWGREADDATLWFSPRQYFKYTSEHGSEALRERFAEIYSGELGSYDSELSTVLTNVIKTVPEAKELFDSWFTDLYAKAGYSESGFEYALETGHEIMLKCSEYSLITDEVITPSEIKFLADHIGKPELVEEIGAEFTPIGSLVHILARHLFGG